jgi:hypothetical protein
MDESGDESNRAARIHPKLKYMRMLQNVADRKISQVLIDLDDLTAVCFVLLIASFHLCNRRNSLKKQMKMKRTASIL